VLVIDDAHQSNRAAEVIGGLLGFDRRRPAELYAKGREELDAYPTVDHLSDRVIRGGPVDGGFAFQLGSGNTVYGRRVLLATGMDYTPPDLPGVADLWGSSVFQCPFCHGWEMRDKRLAALASGSDATHAALMLRGWTDDVVLLTDGPSGLDAASKQLLESAKVSVEQRPITELISSEGMLTAIAFTDGDQLARDGLLVEAPLRQRSALAEQLGASCTPGSLAADALTVDALHRTNVPTVFAAGDLCAEQPYIAGAIAAGSQAAMIVVQSLLAEEFGLPYPPG
jgi:thioredoxin reductase